MNYTTEDGYELEGDEAEFDLTPEEIRTVQRVEQRLTEQPEKLRELLVRHRSTLARWEGELATYGWDAEDDTAAETTKVLAQLKTDWVQ